MHLRTHHLWRTIKEVGLLSEDHLPQSMTQPVLNQAIHLHPCGKGSLRALPGQKPWDWRHGSHGRHGGRKREIGQTHGTRALFLQGFLCGGWGVASCMLCVYICVVEQWEEEQWTRCLWVGLSGVLRATATAAGPEAVDSSKAQTAAEIGRGSFVLLLGLIG